jgi:hypothetical protein
MPSEATSIGALALSPRVTVARLTLQLRASLQEAMMAEARASAAESDTRLPRAQARIQAILEQRRRTLDETLARARVEVDAAVAEAYRQSAAILSDASWAVEEAAPSPVGAPSSIVDAAAAVEIGPSVAGVVRSDDDPVTDNVATHSTIALNGSLPATAAWQQSAGLDLPSIKVVIDIEAFAQVFATVFATVLDERLSAWRASTPATPALPPARPRTPLRHALHLDVFLAGLAALIVLVIVLAWIG